MERGKPGSKRHVLSDADGLPLRVGLSSANTHDGQALKPMLSHFHMDTNSTQPNPARMGIDYESTAEGLALSEAGARRARSH